MGFAPMNNPKIAVAVYVENGGWGADYGVPIGGLMMEQYLTGKLSPAGEAIAENMQHRRIGYGPRFPGQERRAAEARKAAAAERQRLQRPRRCNRKSLPKRTRPLNDSSSRIIQIIK